MWAERERAEKEEEAAATGGVVVEGGRDVRLVEWSLTV